ncbi:SDR family oxidoreductase [Swaminathania salitolerans]|uniref:NAD(P)-dependent oxidoreductase n=1 Tax=Swaminathania salitolerans TaxID=182838 RepID=A0A511BLJ9_9PROT|nr:SDR family oxidoreductase [Swaminathania salitolerans]GBQ10233.1 dehydrogenase [Swaminathania salitolerans LMG 21291]GEL01220.1 NAD(P)-dependent oxidoreductase [Swaminathania salitolerans]
MNRLAGKRAIVTGAGQGIGRASALRFAAEGAEVFAIDRNEEAIASMTSCHPVALDLLDPAAIASHLGGLGPVDILFNCAGYVDSGTVLDMASSGYRLSFALNVHAMVDVIRAVLPAMLDRGGSIINMASVASSVIGVPNRFAYGTTKAAVIGLSKSIAVDYVTRKIRCNVICPGTVQSPSLDERLSATGDAVAARAAFVARQPMGRIGTAEEIAELALYLASDASAYTTGSVHVIDGGWTAA